MIITHANIQFNDNGTPFSTEFDDLYFSDANGLEETNYVFLLNNGLPERWNNWPNKQFTIAETGFGTGLNFLATLKLFDQFLQHNPHSPLTLHFISIEKFPISLDDLSTALTLYPDLKPYVDELIAQYPLPIAGCQRLHFLQHKVTLDLWFGDVHEVLPLIENQKDGLVDTWFLDGFAPSKNPEMWTQSLFGHMARFATPHCHFATFTAAGFVRRGLIEAGFEVQRRSGYGRKREMLAGVINKQISPNIRLPYYIRTSAIHSKKTDNQEQQPRIAIIGAGLAGASCAHALAKKGLKSTIYCKENALAQGASGNPQGGFFPALNATAGINSQLHVSAFTHASRLYKQLLVEGHHFSHDWCGTILLSFNDKVSARYRKLIDNQTWPESLVKWIDDTLASTIANVDLPYSGLFIPDAGWINPPELVQALVNSADADVSLNKELIALEQQQDKWLISWQNGAQTEADIVILATGSESPNVSHLSDIPFRLTRGQVEAVPTFGSLEPLATVLCHKGYLAPAWQGHHALGSTYIKQDTNCEYRDDEQKINMATHQKCLSKCDWIDDVQAQHKGRAAIRCSTPDHLPVVGNVPDLEQQQLQYWDLYKALPAAHYPQPTNQQNLYVLSGLGSRGLTTAPLCAEILASQITGQALPLPNTLLDALSPNRFLVRSLIRREL